MVKKVVVAAAGLGTRLLSFTKEQPKEMLPVFSMNNHASLLLKPMLQLIFEQMYDFGMREFCFVVGRGKRAIEDHFTPDYEFAELLKKKDKDIYEKYGFDLDEFYTKLRHSSIFWVNQSPPLGFGHAVLQAESYVGGEDFFVVAGDTIIISDENQHLKRLTSCSHHTKAEAAFLLMQVDHPENYGVAQVTESSEFLRINRVTEKPPAPDSDLALMPVYIFKNSIFEHLRAVLPGKGSEIQLTDAIQSIIASGKVVAGTRVRKDELMLDIGSPHTYFKAQTDSYNYGVEQLYAQKP